MIKRVFFLALLCCTLVFAQLSNSITVSVSKIVNLQADQLIYGITVQSGLDITRDQVVAALQAAGITQPRFENVFTQQQYSPSGRTFQVLLVWQFSFATALSNQKSTIALLSSAQAAIAKNNPGFMMSFGANGTQVSPQAQQAVSCTAADLLADARARAQKMATAAGQQLGAIAAISSSSVGTDPVSGILATPTYLPTCYLTARFALGTAQPLDSDTLSIAASRILSVQPDQVLVAVSVNAPATASLQDVIDEVPGFGITSADLSAAHGAFDGDRSQWVFTLAIPFAKLGDTLTRLASLQQKIGGPVGQPDLNFNVQGARVSDEVQAAQSCSFQALVTDAQAQAQKLASAAGLTLGPVVSVSDGSTLQSVGVFSAGIASVPYGILSINQWFSPAPTPAQPCALTVQFKIH